VSVICSIYPECRYFLVLRHPATSKLILHPAPVYLISRQIKALKNFKSTIPDNLEYSQARSTLGKVFGTKKAEVAIHAQERNKLGLSAMEDVAGVLQDRTDEGTENPLTHKVRPGFYLFLGVSVWFWYGNALTVRLLMKLTLLPQLQKQDLLTGEVRNLFLDRNRRKTVLISILISFSSLRLDYVR
jgi:hypothetical protein